MTAPEAKPSGWWDIPALIAGLANATPTQKYFLSLVHLHTNHHKRKAWVSQENLAREMNVSPRQVRRLFDWAKTFGLVGIEQVRKGRRPGDQFNCYWLNVAQLKEFQRATR